MSKRHRTVSGPEGRHYDNALAETINGLYKAEVIHRRGPWKTSKRGLTASGAPAAF